MTTMMLNSGIRMIREREHGCWYSRDGVHMYKIDFELFIVKL
jgi:hypothetical protein